jgi:hypothetical protein
MAVGDDQPTEHVHAYVPTAEPVARQPRTNGTWSALGADDNDDLRSERQPDADGWDFDPDITLPNDAYRGVRRASASRSSRRAGLVVGVLVVAAVVVVIAMKLGADTTSGRVDGDARTLLPSESGAGLAISPPLSEPAATTGVPVAGLPVGVPAFAPLTFEAEAGPPTVKRRGGDVETLAGASGGRVVRFADGSGELEIRGVAFTVAGTYRIAIYYGSEAAGKAVVSIPNAAPVTASFASWSGCCATEAVDVALPSEQQTVTISEITSGVVIDRIVITRLRP